MFCIKCGATMEEGAKCCSGCGAEIKNIPDDNQKKNEKEMTSGKKRKSGSGWRIGVIAVAAVCIVAAVVIFAIAIDRETITAAIADAAVGDIIFFGSYEQDNNTENGMEPVEWYVLDKTDEEATLLSVYLLDEQTYHEKDDDITWENCTLRSWLNGEFYNTAFSEEEQAVIVNTNVVNEDNPYFGTEGGNDTVDKVWLLSFGEIERYFHTDSDVYDNSIFAYPTAYAEAEGLWEVDDWWWLRSPGCYGYGAAYVSGSYVSGFGEYVDFSGIGVRPAIKVAY